MPARGVDRRGIARVGVARDADAGIVREDALEFLIRVARPIGDDHHAGVQ